MSATHGAGRFVSWNGGCLFIGESGRIIPEHAHYAIQIAFGSRPGIRFSTHGMWRESGGAIIPSRQPHLMDATGVGVSAVLLVEPETPQGRALAKRIDPSSTSELPDQIVLEHVPVVFAAYRRSGDSMALQNACQDLISATAGHAAQSQIVDERISRATAFINNNLHLSLTLDAVANEACLSPSRFRHLFVEDTGMTFRSYVLWRRFMHVWELLAKGSTLSTAAHAAGFADAAHLTRTSNTMFGFPPSALQVEKESLSLLSPIAHNASTLTRVANASNAVANNIASRPSRHSVGTVNTLLRVLS